MTIENMILYNWKKRWNMKLGLSKNQKKSFNKKFNWGLFFKVILIQWEIPKSMNLKYLISPENQKLVHKCPKFIFKSNLPNLFLGQKQRKWVNLKMNCKKCFLRKIIEICWRKRKTLQLFQKMTHLTNIWEGKCQLYNYIRREDRQQKKRPRERWK